MSTRFRVSREYPHDLAAFRAALADPEFHRDKLDVDGTGRVELVDASREGPAPRDVRVVLRQPVPAGQVPAVVEQLLTGRLLIERTEWWRLGDEACHGSARVVVPGTPITAAGAMSVERAGSGSRLDVDLEVTASVPLVGGGIERAVVSGIRRLTGTEHARISAWLDAADGIDGGSAS